MRKRWLISTLALCFAAAGPAASHGIEDAVPSEPAPLFAAGGTALTNGYFFPGTAIYDGEELQGTPYQISRGQDIEFTTADGTLTAGNGHQMRSFKRRRNGRPLFQSKFIADGQSTLVITSHLKPGTYDYFCTVHYQMYGILEVTTG